MKKIHLTHTKLEVKFLKTTWIFGLILLAHQIHAPESLTIQHEQETIITVNRSDFTHPIPGLPFAHEKKLDLLIGQLQLQVQRPPRDARLGSDGSIVPEQAGAELNQERFRDEFGRFFYNSGPGTIDVPIREIFPRVDSELLANIRTRLIGHYATYFNSRNKERSHNIALAAEAIDNHVVFPGETFSFNRIVGNRTKKKGYLPAPIIVRGELSEGIGGGICQVSSTLFNAVDRSGLKILERYSHSKRVPYVPPGRDATVSWYGPDFTFINKYNQPILIRAKVTGGMMAVMIFSSDAVNAQPRLVPSAAEQLPAETRVEGNIH
jgi:vancomycin resistance protein YoaR